MYPMKYIRMNSTANKNKNGGGHSAATRSEKKEDLEEQEKKKEEEGEIEEKEVKSEDKEQKNNKDNEENENSKPKENSDQFVEDEAIKKNDATKEILSASSTEFEFQHEEGVHRYYHYFDTHKVYSGLKYSGFNDGQADVLMLTIRDMLSRKLAECKESHPLISQADNDAYLFDAACSEIRNEIQTARQAQNEEYRANQARLTRDFEILQQEVNEMVNTQKSEIEMDVNERKNHTKALESDVEGELQELNNKITIDLSSEVKSKIEALRWQTTRRGLLAVLFVAFAIMMGTSTTKKEQKPKRRESVVTTGGDEYQVPVLTTSEVDDGSIDEPQVEKLDSSLASK